MPCEFVEHKPVWNLEDSLKLIRTIQPLARNSGFHLALGGGVLNIGCSYKDLDIIACPGSDKNTGGLENASLEGLLKAFTAQGHFPMELRTYWEGILLFKLYGNIDLVVPLITKLDISKLSYIPVVDKRSSW